MNPDATSPTLDNIDVCATHDPPVLDPSIAFNCGAKGRYLVVMLEGNGNQMNICEVQVFGGKCQNFQMSYN